MCQLTGLECTQKQAVLPQLPPSRVSAKVPTWSGSEVWIVILTGTPTSTLGTHCPGDGIRLGPGKPSALTSCHSGS